MNNSNVIIARAAIILVYYFLGAYGTTDILRLKKGSEYSVDDNTAYCPSCRHKLILLEQIPIFAFIVHKGRCRYCQAPIPIEHEIIEITIFSVMTLLTVISGFSWTGYLLCVFFYIMLKSFFLWRYGLKKKNRKAELVRSIRSNIIIFLIYGIIYLMQMLAYL